MLSQFSGDHVFDSRTRSEVSAAQNRLPAEPPPAYFNPPVTHGEFDFVQALKRIKAGMGRNTPRRLKRNLLNPECP